MNRIKRLALFVFFDKDGFVGDYIRYYVKALKEITDRTVFIVNGEIQPEGKKEIEGLGAEVFCRENKGLDFGAWKDVILKLGFDEIDRYDELVLCNCSNYGPVYPFSEMFSEMESRKCDFWGITRHPGTGTPIIGGDPSSAIVEHIQSYFIVFTRKVTGSEGFREWWNTLEPTSDYLHEVAFHENRFTQYLKKYGFSYDTYVDCDKYLRRNCPYNQTFACAEELLTKDRDPLVKRKLFINEAHVWTETGEGFTPIRTFEELQKTSYPLKYIYSDLLHSQKLSSIKDGMALTWVHQRAEKYKRRSLALVCHACHADLAGFMSSYLLNMPEGADLYLISPDEGVLDAYRKLLDEKKASELFRKINFLMKPTRGSDAAALLMEFAPYAGNYEGFCFVHDIKSDRIPCTLTNDLMRRGLECCLESKSYAKDLAEALFESPLPCGVMLPPTPYFSFCLTLGAETYDGTTDFLRQLYDRLNLKVPFDDKPMAPFGTMFWARTDALRDLLECKWSYEDFPGEPAASEHTISQAIERVICCCAQNRGYFSKWAMPESFAGLYINNLSYRMRDYNAELNRIYGRSSWFTHLGQLKAVPAANQGSAGQAGTAADTAFSYVRYLKYKLLYKITFGRKKEHYREKYMELKAIKRERRIQFL